MRIFSVIRFLTNTYVHTDANANAYKQINNISRNNTLVISTLQARVTIRNYYQYRHVEIPGWSLGWTWPQDEIIWSMSGALATHQGNCSQYKYRTPHSCKRDPVIIDLTPDAAPENRTANCCRSGILSARAIDQTTSSSSFDIVVGGLGASAATPKKPHDLTLLAPGSGYTCGPLEEDPPTVVPVGGGRREEQVFSKTSRRQKIHNSHSRELIINVSDCL